LRRILGLGITLAAVVLVVVVPASPAAAHAELVSTEPASGEVLPTAPEQVVLHFTEGVQVGDDAVELFASAGDEIDVGEVTTADRGAAVAVDVPALDDGAYVVAWRVTSADSHPIHGAFTFRVGAAASSDDEAEALMSQLVADEGGDTLVGAVYGAVRFVAFAGMVLLVGGAAFLVVLWPAGRDDARARRLLVAGWLTFAIATVLSIGLQGAYAAAEPLSGAVDTSLIGDVLGTRAGSVWLIRLAILVGVAIAGWRLLPRPQPSNHGPVVARDAGAAARVDPADNSVTTEAGGAGDLDTTAVAVTAARETTGSAGVRGAAPTALSGLGARFPVLTTWHQEPAKVVAVGIVALALLATVSLAGHAGTGSVVPLALVLDVVHLAAISTWLGGLVLLVAVVVRVRDGDAPAGSGQGAVGDGQAGDRLAVERVVAGFSTVAFAAVVAIVITGALQGWRQLGSVGAITDTTYGRLLVVKVLLVAAMLVAAAFSRRWVQHRLTRAPVSRPEGDDGSAVAGSNRQAVRALRRSVGAEVVVAAGVLAVTALLVNTVPGVDDTQGSFEEEIHGTDLLVLVEVDPASTGPADIRIDVNTHAREPVEPEELTASLTLPERDLGPIPLNLEQTGEGIYEAAGMEIPFEGTWHLEIDARLSEFDQETITTEIPID